MIHLATLPQYYRTRKGISMIVRDYNLPSGNAKGKGNRAKRRQGLYVPNPDHMKPFGLIGMDRGQIAAMMKRPA